MGLAPIFAQIRSGAMKAVMSESGYRGIAAGILLFVGLACFPAIAAAPLELITQRDPSQPAPAGGNSDSLGAIPSPDGRFVLFSSSANNLVSTTNGTALPVLNPGKLNVFLRDRTNGTTTLVSVNLSG